MRRYKIVLTAPNTSNSGGTTTQGAITGTSSAALSSTMTFRRPATVTYDSQINGQDNPSALDIAFDISNGALSTSFQGSYVEIFGLSLQDVTKVRQWQGGKLQIYGGFSPGFPLANPKQYGLLSTATIQQAYGNWTGTQQSVVFILFPEQDSTVIFQWKTGQTLSSAIRSAITAAYPGYTVKSYLAYDPVAVADDIHCSPSIFTFRDYIARMTSRVAGYSLELNGVDICLDNTGSIINLYNIFNAPVSATPVQLAFNDLQGQPVYFGPSDNTAAVQTALNLRYDLALAGRFTFPTQVATGYLLNQPASGTVPLAKNNSALTGTFTITTLRHVGRFRDPHGESWVTVVEGNPLG